MVHYYTVIKDTTTKPYSEELTTEKLFAYSECAVISEKAVGVWTTVAPQMVYLLSRLIQVRC